jgi:hypothetical protein
MIRAGLEATLSALVATGQSRVEKTPERPLPEASSGRAGEVIR